jgi:4-hydroxy-2-oxoheptanedioate aldolase
MMNPNPLRQLWAKNRAAINGWLAIPNSFSAEVMARQGWDSLTIDLQHGLIEAAQLTPLLQAISQTPTVPLVRVPWNDPGVIMKSLDAGAMGIICPMINTREEAQRFAAMLRVEPAVLGQSERSMCTGLTTPSGPIQRSFDSQ